MPRPRQGSASDGVATAPCARALACSAGHQPPRPTRPFAFTHRRQRRRRKLRRALGAHLAPHRVMKPGTLGAGIIAGLLGVLAVDAWSAIRVYRLSQERAVIKKH